MDKHAAVGSLKEVCTGSPNDEELMNDFDTISLEHKTRNYLNQIPPIDLLHRPWVDSVAQLTNILRLQK